MQPITRNLLIALVIVFLIPCGSRGLADEADSGDNHKIISGGLRVEPTLLSPGTVDGRRDLQRVDFMNTIRTTDELGSKGEGEVETFYVDWSVRYSKKDTGGVVRLLSNVIVVPPPPSHIHSLDLPVSFPFDGKGDDQKLLGDGVYLLTIDTVFRKGEGQHNKGKKKGQGPTNPEKIVDTDHLAGGEVMIDNTPPALDLKPPTGTITNANRQTVEIDYWDNLSGIDLSSFFVSLNGDEITSNFTKDESGASAEVTLLEGQNILFVRVRDLAGNESSRTVEIFVDTVSPTIQISSPSNGQVISNEPLPEIVVTYSDPAPSSGLDLDSLVVTIDGQEVAPAGSWSDRATVPLPSDLKDGSHTVRATVRDRASNLGEARPVTFILSVESPLPPSFVEDSIVTPDPVYVSAAIPKLPRIMVTTPDPRVVALEFTFTVKDSAGNVREVHQAGSTTLFDEYDLGLPPRKARLFHSPSGSVIVLPGAPDPANAEFVGYIFYSTREILHSFEPGNTVEITVVAIDEEGNRSVVPSALKVLEVPDEGDDSLREPIELIESREVTVRSFETTTEPLPLESPGRFNIFDRYEYLPGKDDDFAYSLADEGATFTGVGTKGNLGSLFRATANILQRNSPSIIVRRETLRLNNDDERIEYRMYDVPFGMIAVTAVEPLVYETNWDDDFEYAVYVQDIRPGNELTPEQISDLAGITGIDPVVLAHLNASLVIGRAGRGRLGSYTDIRITQILIPQTLSPEIGDFVAGTIGNGTSPFEHALERPLGSGEPSLVLLNQWSYIPTAPESAQVSKTDLIFACAGSIADDYIDEEDFRIDVRFEGCDLFDYFLTKYPDPNDDDFLTVADWFEDPLDANFINVNMRIEDGNWYSKQFAGLILAQFPVKVP